MLLVLQHTYYSDVAWTYSIDNLHGHIDDADDNLGHSQDFGDIDDAVDNLGHSQDLVILMMQMTIEVIHRIVVLPEKV